MSDKKTLTTVPLNAIVDISVSGQFLVDLQQGLMHLYELHPSGKMQDALKDVAELTTREPKNKWEAHILLYFNLIYAIESKFKEKGLTSERTQEEIEQLVKDSQGSSPEN
jgi:hypothetical protein